MNAQEFAELVEMVQDRFGTGDEVWANADRVAADFKRLDAVEVFAAFADYCTDPASDLRWAPRPPELVRRARIRMRQAADPTRRPQLPDRTAGEGGFWKDWSLQQFGEVRRLMDVVRERHAELPCESPVCKVHRDRPARVEGMEVAL